MNFAAHLGHASGRATPSLRRIPNGHDANQGTPAEIHLSQARSCSDKPSQLSSTPTCWNQHDSFVRRLKFFISELDAVGTRSPFVALAEAEQMLMVSFLYSNRHSYTEFVERPTHSLENRLVRRVEEYIEAHWDRPVAIEDLVRVTSASARSIFHHFKRSRGYSPMEFARQVRLQHAKRMLTQTDTDGSVTKVALTCGFMNLGHFAKYYFKLFAERPSDTLKRSRSDKR